MKRARSISVEIEHRSLTLSITHSASPEVAHGPGRENSDGGCEPTAAGSPVCPDCGAPWLAVAGITMAASDPAAMTAISSALRQRGLHLHVSPAGELKVCSKSLDEARSQETKESL